MYTLGDGANFSSKWRLHTKVKIVYCIFGDQERKQNISTFRLRLLEIKGLFSSSHHLTPRFANAILVRAKTKIACNLSCIYVRLFSFISNNIPNNYRGAPLLGLAKSIYYSFNSIRLYSFNLRTGLFNFGVWVKEKFERELGLIVKMAEEMHEDAG